jgi:hypothetical protein
MRREAAGGAGEILSVGLRAGSRDEAQREIGRAFQEVAPGLEWRLGPLAEGAFGLEVSLPLGVDLSPILGELGERFRIERVEMRPLKLHEIYVRAVRRDQGGDAGAAALETVEREVTQHA